MNLTMIYRTVNSNSKKITHYSAAHRSVSKIDHILEDKANIYKFKQIQTTACIRSDHNATKLTAGKKKKT